MRLQQSRSLVLLCQRQPLKQSSPFPLALTIAHIHPQRQPPRRWVNTSFPPESHFALKQSRFARFKEQPGEVPEVRNPLNYVELDHRAFIQKREIKRRLLLCGIIISICVFLQAYLLFTFTEPAPSKKKEKDQVRSFIDKERLDASPNSGISEEDARRGVKVIQKPGQPEIKLDEQGLELIETGTSTIPYFPRFIKVPSSSADPSAAPISAVPGVGAEEGLEEYSLLGLGIRTVSFLSVQVYVLGMYVRTTDLDKLQAAFVKHVNPLGSSLIPSEKESLRKSLMEGDGSLEIWDKVLQEVHVRSAVRIVPTRGTDFSHLRDGWVRGITSRTQELAKKGSKDYDDEGFGNAMQEFKTLLGGKGKSPKGSTIVLTRDERGTLSVMYEPEKKSEKGELLVQRVTNQNMGKMADERISRQVWLGYLGGKNVSSEGAKRSIVDGVMELVERPVGTVGTQVL